MLRCISTPGSHQTYTYCSHCIQTNIHKYIHTYIYTYVHTYMHTYVHIYVRTYIHNYVHTYVRTCIHTVWYNMRTCKSGKFSFTLVIFGTCSLFLNDNENHTKIS